MQLEFVPYPLLVGLTILFLLLPVRWHMKRSRFDLFCFTLFGLYLLVVIDLLLFPIPTSESRHFQTPTLDILACINWVPLNFGGLFDMPPIYAVYELGGNILLTVPFGFSLPFLFRIKPSYFPLLAVLVGLSTELMQLIVSLIIGGNYRSVDINDALLNAIGVLIGCGLFKGVVRVFSLLFRYYRTMLSEL